MVNIDGVNYRCVLLGKEFNLVANRKQVGKDTGYDPIKILLYGGILQLIPAFLACFALVSNWNFIWIYIFLGTYLVSMAVIFLLMTIELKKQDGEA